MFRSILRRLRQISRRIHVRVILYAGLALVAQGIAFLAGPLIPEWLGDRIGAGAVDPILNTLASSMLAVTTFSLTIMVTALNNAGGNWTPRSLLILREDTVTHSVLANFLGAYLFALVAIILRAASAYDERSLVVIYGMTLFVVAMIVISLIRWIVHLEGLGSLPHTAAMIEAEALEAMRRDAAAPCCGGHALTDPANQIPEGAVPLLAAEAGYLQQVFEDRIEAHADRHGLRVFLTVTVGGYLLRGGVLGFVAGDGGAVPDAAALEPVREALPLAQERSYDEDPLFGLTVLAEIGTRALSPGVNDPGTAIDVAHRLSRVLVTADTRRPEAPRCPRLWAPPLDPDAFFEASVDPLARCAGSAVEVHVAIRHALAQVTTAAADPAIADSARRVAARCLARAEAAITFAPDLERLRAVPAPA